MVIHHTINNSCVKFSKISFSCLEKPLQQEKNSAFITSTLIRRAMDVKVEPVILLRALQSRKFQQQHIQHLESV